MVGYREKHIQHSYLLYALPDYSRIFNWRYEIKICYLGQ